MDVRAKCLLGLGLMCERQGNYAEAKMHWLESQHLYQALGDRVHEASMSAALGVIAIDERDFAQAHKIFLESVAFCQQEDLTFGLASAYSNLGFIANAQAHYATAIQYFDDAIRLRRMHGSQTDLAWCLSQLGYAQAYSDDMLLARASFLECLSLCQQLGDALTTLDALEGMALIASCCEHEVLGIQLYAAAERHNAEMGTQNSLAHPLGPMSREERLEALRRSMGLESFAKSWQKGTALSLDEAILLAREEIGVGDNVST